MVHYKLSPNEEARILKEEREKRRIQRLQQVREQGRINAAKLRHSVKKKKEELTEAIAENLEKEWDIRQQEKLYRLEAAYEQSLQGLGESHRNAVDENPEWRQECRELLDLQEKDRAAERHQVAVQKQRQELEERQQEEQRHIMTRLMALDIEKYRAQKIASLPKPKPDPVDNIEMIKLRPVKFTDRDAFATSRYHIPETIVEKENYQHQADAKSLAVVEDEKYKDVEDTKKTVQHERAERARLRHKVAVEKELLKHDYSKLLHDLSDLQRADLNRRRQAVEKLPKQIFLAPHRRLEEKEERQLNMERAFEDVYMAATDFTGDLSLALDPHPVVPSTTPSLDVTTEIPLSEEEEESFSRTVTISKEAAGVMRGDQRHVLPPTQPPGEDTQHSGEFGLRSTSPIQVEQRTASDISLEQGKKTVNARSLSNLFSGRTSSSNLRKVFDKIKAQREEWIRQSIQESPERDKGRDSESMGTEPKSLSQYTVSSNTGDSPMQPIRLLPHHLSGSTYSLSGGTMTTMSDGGMDFNTPPVAEAFLVQRRLSSGSSGRPSVSDAGSVASNVSHAAPSSSGSQITCGNRLTTLNHPDMCGILRQHQPTSALPKDLNSGSRDVIGKEDALRNKIELQQKEFERQRKMYEDQLKMLEEKKHRLKQQQSLSHSSDFYREEAPQLHNCLLAEQKERSQSIDITDSTASIAKSCEQDNSAMMWANETHAKSIEPLYSSDTGRNLASTFQLNCANPGSTFSIGSLSNDGCRSGASSVLADGLGLNREQVKRYQAELLRRQANQQTALALAREKLQLQAQQLLDKNASHLSSSHMLSFLNTLSSESNTDRMHSGVCGNELSAILETSERLELSAHPMRLDRYVSPSEDHSDSVLRDFLADSSHSSMSAHPSKLTQHSVAYEDPTARNANDGPSLSNMAHSSESTTHCKEGEHGDQRFKGAQFQTTNEIHPLAQKNCQLPQSCIKHDDLPKDPDALSQYSMSDGPSGSRSWGSHSLNDVSPISADHRTLVADSDCTQITENLVGGQQVFVQTSGQIVDNNSIEKVLENDPLIGGLNVEGRMTVDHHSSFEDQRSNTSCSDQEFPLQCKKVEHHDISSRSVPESVLPSQAISESQTSSVVSEERFCHLESDAEDDFASHGLISYSGNVYKEWRPLIPDDSPKSAALEHSQQVEQSISTKTQNAPEAIAGGAVNELIIKGTFKETNAAAGLHTFDLHGKESSSICKDESFRAGYWSFHGFQGVRAFHTALSDMQFTNHDPLQDDETTFPVFEESKSNESEKCPSEKLTQFPIPNMQSTLIFEDSNGMHEMSPPNIQNPEASLSQHSFTGSLNSRLSSEVGPELHFIHDSNQIQSIPPSTLSKAGGVEPPADNRSLGLKQYQPEFYSLVSDATDHYRHHDLSGGDKKQGFATGDIIPLRNDPMRLSETVFSINSKSCNLDLRKEAITAATSFEQDRMLMNEETNGSTCTKNKWGEIFETYRSTNTVSKSSVVYDVSKYEDRAQKNNQSELCDDELQFTLKVSANEEVDTDANSNRPYSFDITATEPGILDEPELTLVSANSPTMSSHGLLSHSSSPMHKNLESSSLLSFERHELSARSTSLASRSGQFTEHSEQKKLPLRSRNGSSVTKEISDSVASDKFSGFLLVDENSKPSDSLQRPGNQSKYVEPFSETDDWLNSTGNSASGPDGVSLQDAFIARKKDFIVKSVQRVVEAKEKARTSHADNRQLENQQHLTKTVSSYMKSRAVQNKQGSQLSQDTGNISETSSEDRKLAEKEMKNRTARLYSQLEEVKHKKEEEDRKAFYAQNREKRRDYEKKHTESKKKKTARK